MSSREEFKGAARPPGAPDSDEFWHLSDAVRKNDDGGLDAEELFAEFGYIDSAALPYIAIQRAMRLAQFIDQGKTDVFQGMPALWLDGFAAALTAGRYEPTTEEAKV